MNAPSSRTTRTAVLLLSAAALTAVGGCASAPMPSDQLAVAAASVQRANTSSTAENAGTELQIAVAKLASARQAVADKDPERARRLAEQADLDAQVAEMHAQAARSRKAALESQDAARALREELGRKPPR
jgi:hypothetical protein